MIIFSILLLSSTVFAGTQTILSITNDMDDDLTCMYLRLDNSRDVEKLIITDCNPSDRSKPAKTVTPAELIEGKWVYKKAGHNIIKLSSRNFSAHNGGHIQVNYLYNGLRGTTRYMTFELSRDGDSWLVKSNGQKISKLHFFARRWFGQLVGIANYSAQ